MEIYSLFPTPIGQVKLNRDFTTEELKFIDSQEKYKNSGNATSLNRQVLRNAEFTNLKNFVDNFVDEYFKKVFSPSTDVKLKVTQSWLNYTKKDEFHHQHTHQNSFISGVLLLKADTGKDKIHFMKNHYQQIKIKPKDFNEFNSDSWWYELEVKQLILFPSSLSHMVKKFEGEERVSLAFNTFPVGHIGDVAELTSLYIND